MSPVNIGISGDARPEPARPRGRPRLVIDNEQLLDVVQGLFAQGGLEAVSIERVAEELGISRATLYRAIPSKDRLVGALLHRLTAELTSRSLKATADDGRAAGVRLRALMLVHFEAAIEMQDYLYVFFEADRLESEDYKAWRRFARDYERIWAGAVSAAAAEGAIAASDPVIAARLMIGSIIWVSRWYRPDMGIDAEQLTEQAALLLKGTGR